MTSPSSAIAAIAFDLGNVLVKVDHGRFCRRLGELAGVTPQEVYTAVFDTTLEFDYDTGRVSSREFHRRLQARLGLNLPCLPPPGVLDRESSLPWTTWRRWQLAWRNATPCISSPIPMSGTSSISGKTMPRLLQPFRAFILSYRVGGRKPEAAIFQALIRQAGVPPARILYTDDKEDFVAAARTHGLTAWPFVSPADFQEQLSREGLW